MDHKVARCPKARRNAQMIYELTDEFVEDDSPEAEEEWATVLQEINSGKCYNCDQPGHFQNKCPKPKKPKKLDNMEAQIKKMQELLEALQRDNNALRDEVRANQQQQPSN